MSFILEALKKSEQQRQQQNAPQQQVRKRTLALSPRQPRRRPLWLLAAFIPLILAGGWLLYDKPVKPAAGSLPAESATTMAPAAHRQAEAAAPSAQNAPAIAPVVAEAPVAVTPSPTVAVEPAPVPRQFIASPAAVAASVTVAQDDSAAAQATEAEPAQVETSSSQLPRYRDLPESLRKRMPSLAMSMHFYSDDPDRRLVRINKFLLHEQDWLGSDLQLIAITPRGATLGFMGQLFELRGSAGE